MRAALYKQLGSIEEVVVEDIAPPVPDKGQVAVSVKAVGIAFPDVLLVQGKYQVKFDPPFSPGFEFAGVVKSVGEGVTAFKAGDTVLGRGYQCAREEVAVDAKQVWKIPAGMDFGVAAGFGMNYATTYHALKDRGELKAGETLLVLGASGGVGLAAVELGKLMGARVIACASSQEKLETCRRFGADELINYETQDLRAELKRITGGKGVDVCYDPVGDKYAEPCVRSMAWGGRYLVVGFAAGEIPKIPLNLALLKGCALVGVFWGEFTRRENELAYRNTEELIRMVADGRLKPLISATYPLGKVGQALADLLTRKVQGKVVVDTTR
jgi:NADPH2:quinone reductase